METVRNIDDTNAFLQMEIPRYDGSMEISCNVNDSVEQCLSFLYGTSRRPVSHNKEHDKPTLVSAIQRLTVLLSESKKTCEALEERNQRLSSDLNQAYTTENRHKSSVEQAEKQILIAKEKERQLLVKLKTAHCELKVEKDEGKRMKSVLLQKEVQYQHEIRRKERELTQMSEQLYKAVSDRRQENRPGMQILNVVARSDGSRGKWNTEVIAKKLESEFLKTVTQGYEKRNSQLLEENVALKDTLATFLYEIETFAEDHHTPDKDIESVAESCNTEQSSNKFSDKDSGICSAKALSFPQLHFSAENHQDASTFFQEKWKIIKEYLSFKMCKQPAVLDRGFEEKQEFENEIAHLKEELAQKQIINDEQEKLLEAAVTVDSTANPYLKDGFILEEKEHFQKERNFFLEQRSNFEKERKAFTEAAVRLAREQREFEERRNNILKLHDIAIDTTPFRQKLMRHDKRRSDRKSLPSTPELYQVLGLTNRE